MIRHAFFAAGLALAAALAPAWSAEANCAPAVPEPAAAAPADPKGTLDLLSLGDSCLGKTPGDPAGVTQAVAKASTEPVALGKAGPLVLALDALLAEARAASLDTTESALWAGILLELQGARREAESLQGQGTPAEWTRATNLVFAPKWAAARSGRTVTFGGTAANLLGDPGCAAGQPCPAFDSRVRALRVAILMASLAQYAQRPELARLLGDSTLELDRWRAYRDKTHPQYVWELAINSARMGKSLCPTDGQGQRLGFCSTPNSQLIVLHPSAALRLSRSARKSSELRPAALVQIVGWYGWNWASVDGRPTAEPTRPWGASLAATYTQSDHEKRWAFGPMFHYGKASLALTKAGGGGKWSLVVNVSLADRYFSTRDRVVEELSTLKKKSAGQLVFD